MIRDIFIQVVRFTLLILAQILIVNHFQLTSYLNPYFYIFFIMMLPLNIAPPVLLACGFLTGIVMDSFMGTGGMHTLATTFMAYLRIFLLRAILSKEQLDIARQPDIASIGITGFLFYASTLTFLHHLVLFFTEAFTFSEFIMTLQRVLFSSVTTLLLIILVHFLFFRVKARE